MINALTTKLEIDVMQEGEVDQAMQLAVVHGLPAVVVHQQLVTQALAVRARRHGQFKVIVAVDWPRGDAYGMAKLRGMTREMLGVDGYEIMTTGGRSEAESRSEARTLIDFITQRIGRSMEVRFILGWSLRPEQEAVRIAGAMSGTPAPAMVRTDAHLKAQVTKVNQRTHAAAIAAIRAACSLPIKVSGNVDSARTVAGLSMAGGPLRFAVSLQQLLTIIKDIQAQPDELHRLLAASDAPADDSEDADGVESLIQPAR